jgi:hypothetical protein
MYSVQLIQAHNSVYLQAQGPYFIRQFLSVFHRRSSAATVGGRVRAMRYWDTRADSKWQLIAVRQNNSLYSINETTSVEHNFLITSSFVADVRDGSFILRTISSRKGIADLCCFLSESNRNLALFKLPISSPNNTETTAVPKGMQSKCDHCDNCRFHIIPLHVHRSEQALYNHNSPNECNSSYLSNYKYPTHNYNHRSRYIEL